VSKEECPLCDVAKTARRVEEEFCRLVGAKDPDRCREVMRARRMGKITESQLFKELGITPKKFDRILAKAIKKATRR